MDIKEYQKHVRTMFETDSDLKFSNGKKEHATVILVEFFQRAQKEVVIFCEDLDNSVYDNPAIISSMEAALRRGVSVSVIAQKEPTGTSFLERGRELHDDLAVAGMFRCVDGSRYSGVEFNFAVMDGKAVRLEPDKNKPEARASANWREMGEHLTEQFRSIFEGLKDCPVPV